jgi:hypothetical protein
MLFRTSAITERNVLSNCSSCVRFELNTANQQHLTRKGRHTCIISLNQKGDIRIASLHQKSGYICTPSLEHKRGTHVLHHLKRGTHVTHHLTRRGGTHLTHHLTRRGDTHVTHHLTGKGAQMQRIT